MPLDNYILGELIGEGATAAVYRAQSASTGDVVAVKLLSGDEAERVRMQATALLELDHPQVVRVREVVEAGSELALVMDFVEGPTLDVWLRQGHRMRPSQVAAFGAALRDAVQTAARLGVVHGDIAPRNIVLSRRGPVLVDVGLGSGGPGGDRAAVARDLAAVADIVELVQRPSAVLPPPTTVDREMGPHGAAVGSDVGRDPAATAPSTRPTLIRLGAAAAVAAAVAAVAVGAAALMRPGQARAGEAPSPPPDRQYTWTDGVLRVTAGPGRAAVSYRLGQPGDQLVLGDWRCRGEQTPAVYRPETGVVWFFDRWPGPGQTVSADRTVMTGVTAGAVAVVKDGKTGCATVSVKRQRGTPEMH
jgi:hypothetical protein